MNKRIILKILQSIGFTCKRIKKRISFSTPELKILPTMNSEMSESNCAWVGTFQLVWNDFMDNEIKGPVKFVEGNNKTVNDLNKQEFKKTDIDESTYYIKSGTICPELKKEIETCIKNKFSETSDILNKINFTYHPLKKLFYAMLKKDFQFLEEFDYLDKGIFHNDKLEFVEYFGIDSDTKEEVYKNISVLFYSDNDYAVKLHTKSEDEVILYRTDKIKAFNEYYKDLKNKTQKYKGEKEFTWNDRLKVPRFDFSAETSFEDVENKIIKNTDGAKISKTIETIKFKMDECGVKLRSEAAFEMMFLGAPNFDDMRYFYFDKPFIMFLKEKDKQVPYFAMRVVDAVSLN